MFHVEHNRGGTDGKIASKGLDWLTITTTNEAIGVAWYETLCKHQKQLPRTAGKIKAWSNPWYTGAQIDGWKWGYSDHNKGYISILSSDTANDQYQRLIGHETNVSRVDTQVTVLLNESDEDYIKYTYDHLCNGGLAIAKKCNLIVGSDGGATLYIGVRTSDTFLRLYDKGVESGSCAPGLLFRYEVERKGRNARAMQYTLSSTENASIRNKFLIRDVQNMFQTRGVHTLFDSDKTDIIVDIGHRTVTTLEKKLIWLRTQVAPTCSELVENGLETEMLDALGLLRIEKLKGKI